jgi:hypothetical protein
MKEYIKNIFLISFFFSLTMSTACIRLAINEERVQERKKNEVTILVFLLFRLFYVFNCYINDEYYKYSLDLLEI